MKGTFGPLELAGYAAITVFTLFLLKLYLSTDMPLQTFLTGPAVLFPYWFATRFAHKV